MRGGVLVLIFALGCGDAYHIQRHTVASKDLGTRADIKTGRDQEWDVWIPVARPPFFPWEAAILAGARRAGDWDAAFNLHLGYVYGRGRRRTHDGAFVGVGVDGRVVADAETEWSAGPIVRAGWAFGPFDGPYPVDAGATNRYSYAYVQAGPSWGGDSRFAASAGFTAFPLSIAVTWESAGPVTILIGPSL